MKSILILLVGLLTSATSASPATDALFRESARSTLQKAMANGLYQLNAVNLARVLAAIDGVRLRRAIIKNDHRTSAVWEPNEITYNPERFERDSFYAQQILSLHEFIGATSKSWKDDSYSHALYIWMIANKKFFEPVLAQFEWPSSLRKPVFEAGGSTTIRGGGDARDIDLKVNTLLCVRSYLLGGSCLSQKLSSVNIKNVIKGLVFANWYVTDKAPEGEFQFHLPKDKSIQATVLIHPLTYDEILRTTNVGAIIDMALTYEEKTGL